MGDELTRELAQAPAVDPVEEDRGLAELQHRLFGSVRAEQRLSRYVIEERIAEGGFGAVYRARDPELDRTVAIKLLHGRGRMSADDTEARTRLIREGQALAQFSHPNVVAVHDVGAFGTDGDGEPGIFIVMEHVAGPTLTEWLAEQPRPWRPVVEVMLAAGRGLAAAHGHGLVHGDIKPSNVILGEDGRARVVDFGLARRAASQADVGSAPSRQDEDSQSALDASVTRAGVAMGTPSFMAPEVHDGARADELADQYSFCVMLYQALFGQLPYRDKRLQDLADAKRTGPPPPVEDRACPQWLYRVVACGLSPDPAQRFHDMPALLAALADDPSRRRRRWAAVTGVAAVVAILGYGWASERQRACEGEDDALAGVWDDAARDRVAAAFAATELPYAASAASATTRLLDDYTQQWVEARKDVCEAAVVRRERSLESMGPAMLCLDRRLRRVRGLVELMSLADVAVVHHSVESASELPPLDGCVREVIGAEALPEDMRVPVLEVEDAIASARLLQQSGKLSTGLDAALQAVALADATGHTPTRARAQLALAELYSATRKLDPALAAVDQSRRLADRADEPQIALDALIHSVEVHALRGELDVAERIATLATDRVALEDPEGDAASRLLRAEGGLCIDQGRPDDAIEKLQAGLELHRRNHGPDDLGVADFLHVLGRAHLELGHYEEAVSHIEQAMEVWRRSLGDDHPNRAVGLSLVANVSYWQGKTRDAVAMYEQAVALADRLMDPKDPLQIDIHHAMARGYDALGRLTDSLKHYGIAIGGLEQHYGRAHLRWAKTSHNIGVVLGKLGRYEESLDRHRESLAVIERTLRPGHPSIMIARGGVGAALFEIGRQEDGLAMFRELIDDLRRELNDDHPYVTMHLFSLGELHVRMDRHTEALAIYDDLLQRKAVGVTPAWIRFWRGCALEGLGRTREAVDEALASRPTVESDHGLTLDLVPPLRCLGRAQAALGRRRDAIITLEQALSILVPDESEPDMRAAVERELATIRG